MSQKKRLSAKDLKKKKVEEALAKSKAANINKPGTGVKSVKPSEEPGAGNTEEESGANAEVLTSEKTDGAGSEESSSTDSIINKSTGATGAGEEEPKGDQNSSETNELNTDDLSNSSAEKGNDTKTGNAAKSDEIKGLEESFTGHEENYSGSFKNGDKLLAFLRYKNHLIHDQETVTTKLPGPVGNDYSFVSEVVSRVTGKKISKQELIGEALIRYLRDVIEKDPVYKKALKAYNELSNASSKKGLY